MRLSTIVLLAFIGLFTASSCGSGNNSDVRKDARQSLGVQERDIPTSEVPPTLPPQPPSNVNAAAAAGGVSHYVCPNNCEGSGGNTQMNCPVCNTQYVHNQAYHNQATNTTTTQTQPATTTTTSTVTPSGPNAAGVWHYTCPMGCEGGSASQGACASCGQTLAHNQAYHN